MAHQLLVTSAPKGLAVASTGYCTVEKTRGLSGAVEPILGKLSNYDYLYGSGDPLNPVGFSHVEVSAAGRKHNVLSRVSDYVPDYSGRSNFLAHHVMPSTSEMEKLVEGPAEILDQEMKTQWGGEPQFVEEIPLRLSATTDQLECHEWRAACGGTRKSAGWAGFLADCAESRPRDPVYILLPDPKQSDWPADRTLKLVREAIRLLPEKRRWRVTFSTYYGDVLAETTCLWRFVVDGSPGFAEALASQHLRIDLTGSMPEPRVSPLVQLAQTGEQQLAPESAYLDTSLRPLSIPEDILLKDDEDTEFREDRLSVAFPEIRIKQDPPDNSKQLEFAEAHRRAEERSEVGASTSPGVGVGSHGPTRSLQSSFIPVVAVSVAALIMVVIIGVSQFQEPEAPTQAVAEFGEVFEAVGPRADSQPQIRNEEPRHNPPVPVPPIAENSGALNQNTKIPGHSLEGRPPVPKVRPQGDAVDVLLARTSIAKRTFVEGWRLTQVNPQGATPRILVFARENSGNSSLGGGDNKVETVDVYGALADRQVSQSGSKVEFKNSTTPGGETNHTVELKDGKLHVEVHDDNDKQSFIKALWATAFVYRFERHVDAAYMCSPPVTEALSSPYQSKRIQLGKKEKRFQHLTKLEDIVRTDDVRAVFVLKKVGSRKGDRQILFKPIGTGDRAAPVSYEMIGVLRNLEDVVADKKMKEIKLTWKKRDPENSLVDDKNAINRVVGGLTRLTSTEAEDQRNRIASLGLTKWRKQLKKVEKLKGKGKWVADWRRMNSKVLKACQSKKLVELMTVNSLKSKHVNFNATKQAQFEYSEAIKELAEAAEIVEKNLNPSDDLPVGKVLLEGSLYVEFYDKSNKKIHVKIPYARFGE